MLPTGQRLPRPFLRLAIVAAIPLVGGIAAAWYFLSAPTPPVAQPSQPAHPHTPNTYAGPYGNLHPDATTVGSETCARCHSDVARVYAHHPMGRSILPVSSQPIGDLAENGRAAFTALGSRFQIDRAGDRLWYTETRTGPGGEVLYEMTGRVNYVVGSGTKGHSFLSERDGFVTQDAVSWFTQKHIWGESPGFSPDLHTGRPIQAGCLYCHANEVVSVPGTVNKYELPLFRNGSAIGCERCHGPGSEHVRLREAGEAPASPDYSIVNLKHLDAPLREAVGQQGHLEGESRVPREGRSPSDYRPGLPLDAVLRVLVLEHRGEDRKAVNHVEQMYLSKCYLGSGGKLGCTTCHNPHEKPPAEKRAERYRAACLKCHDCTSPVATRARLVAPDNCTACHMPQFAAEDIVHAATTDHRIIRTRETPKPGPAPGAADRVVLSGSATRFPEPRGRARFWGGARRNVETGKTSTG